MIRADLHNYLRTSSWMGGGLFNRAVRRTQKRLGFGGIIGVVNCCDKRYEALVNQTGYERENIGNAVRVPSDDVSIVKGQEVMTRQGHLLVLGLMEGVHLKNWRTLEDSLREAKDNNGIIIAGHPFYARGIGPYLEEHRDLLENFDGWEGHNGIATWVPKIAPSDTNFKSSLFYDGNIRWNDGLKIGEMSFSDGHSLYEIGLNYTLLNEPDFSSPEKLVETLRASIQEHKGTVSNLIGDKQTEHPVMAIEHIAKLVGLKTLDKVGWKIGGENRLLEH